MADPVENVRRLYRRMMAGWAHDVLLSPAAPGSPATIAWAAPDATADYRNHDWRSLYAGSVLDD